MTFRAAVLKFKFLVVSAIEYCKAFKVRQILNVHSKHLCRNRGTINLANKLLVLLVVTVRSRRSCFLSTRSFFLQKTYNVQTCQV